MGDILEVRDAVFMQGQYQFTLHLQDEGIDEEWILTLDITTGQGTARCLNPSFDD